MSARIVGVIGAGRADESTLEQARSVGRLLAERGFAVATGGLGGVMEAASLGAREAGGTVIGVLPGADASRANAHVTLPIATGLGEARNVVLVNSCEGFVAVGGEFGTLSEIAFALKAGKPVVSLGSWQVDPAILSAASSAEAVALLEGRL